MKDKECEIGLYGKDNNGELHFYCRFCDEEMEYNEERVCKQKLRWDEKTRETLQKKKFIDLVEDHYWDSLEKDKDLIIKHIKEII